MIRAFGPYRDGFELFNRARSSHKSLQVVEGASHYDLCDRPGPTGEALKRLVPFFEEHLGAGR